MVLTARTPKSSAMGIMRTARAENRLVYTAVADKSLNYPTRKLKIAYIGTIANGVERVAASAAHKAR